MFEPAACDHLRLAGTPIVNCPALAELRVLLRTAQRGDVLEAQHRSYLSGHVGSLTTHAAHYDSAKLF